MTQKEEKSAYLSNGQMTETSNKFCLVEGICSHLHPTHGLHLPVHEQQLVLGDGYVEVWGLAQVRTKGVFVKFYIERRGGVGRRFLLELCCICRSLDSSDISQ